MDKEHIKGAAKKAEGEIKETAGEMTDNKKMQAEGKMDKAEGEVRETAGDVKDAAKH
ncbi:CsbD family protein [Hyphomonas sp.]|uniref:CsbD family protein n=1 Tax=Hyphomonas sp. TaxID=87 RepID=UPI0025B8F33A|nr:CsbD family protein [Hyphomonas sp.]